MADIQLGRKKFNVQDELQKKKQNKNKQFLLKNMDIPENIGFTGPYLNNKREFCFLFTSNLLVVFIVVIRRRLFTTSLYNKL